MEAAAYDENYYKKRIKLVIKIDWNGTAARGRAEEKIFKSN